MSLAVLSYGNVPGGSVDLRTVLKAEISKNFSGANISLGDSIQWVQGTAPQVFNSIQLYGDDGHGNAHFLVQQQGQTLGSDVVAEGWVSFSAWLPAWVAVQRIHPLEKLTRQAVLIQDVDVSRGIGREYRGIILTPPVESSQNIENFESTQSILEGQFLTTSAVRKIPDVRRGDRVKIQLISNSIVLSTDGISEEPGYLGSRIKAMTSKNKREVIGQLMADGVLEVRL